MSEGNNKHSYKLSFYLALIISVASMLLAYAAWQKVDDMSQDVDKIIYSPNPSAEEVPSLTLSDDERVISVSKQASSAVVSIIATAEVPSYESYYGSPFGGIPEEFRQYFNIPEPEQSGTEIVQIGAGTGFIVSSDGYIVTNKHVVSDEDAQYTVFLNTDDSKGEKVKAQVLARDPNNDLAILKIDKVDLPYLEFGNSDSLQVGQSAITIGYALGEFDNTVSRGVISGLARSIIASGGLRQSEQLNDLIQTDAAINPGNSGGPMLNLEGEVIGVNVAMANAENIGFAIPASAALNVFNEVKETGTIKKQETAYLGVRYLLIDEVIQKNNNLAYDYGALIVRGDARSDLAVMPGSPADKAGLVENDIILEVGGELINTRQTLGQLIAQYEPEEKLTLKIYHKGEEKELEVQLEARP